MTGDGMQSRVNGNWPRGREGPAFRADQGRSPEPPTAPPEGDGRLDTDTAGSSWCWACDCLVGLGECVECLAIAAASDLDPFA